jgi:23S rRNA (guanosine2251-2'-O)-methyltransferase
MRLYGKNPVLERIKASPQSIRKLYLQKRTDLSEIVREAKQAGLTFESVDKDWLKDKCGDVHMQGVMAEVKEFEYAPFTKVLSECLENISTPVFLDGVTDPQNLGAIIRNVACLGGFCLVLPEYESAHISETVLRVANGGENYISIAKVTNIASAVKKIKEKGVRVAGALAEDGDDILKADLKFPMAVVIGSEGKGIRPGIRKYLDARLSLPMRGAPLSYNVAVATSLFCYEINRRRWAET